MASKTEEPNVGVWIFLDDSNLWIEGKKLRGELINNTYFKEDPRGRFNLEELKACVRARPGKRRIETAYLYGSEPPSVQRYWDSARNNGWTVKVRLGKWLRWRRIQMDLRDQRIYFTRSFTAASKTKRRRWTAPYPLTSPGPVRTRSRASWS